jgi:hypothetical protein
MRAPLFQGQGGVDPAITWANTSVTVKFTGPTTVVSSSITPDNSGNFSWTAPSQIGVYTVACDFSGDQNYAAGESTFQITVSQEHTLGSVQLYSNPTTPAWNTTQPFTLYIVFHAATGLPVPTGSVSFSFVRGYTGNTSLNPDGALLTKIYPEVPPVGGITVDYTGDAYYSPAHLAFPSTNLTIPGNASGGSGSANSSGSGASGTPGASATTTTTPSATAPSSSSSTPVAGSTSQQNHTKQASSAPNWALILGGGTAALALIGGLGGFLFYRARGKPRYPEFTATSGAPWDDRR